MVVQWTDESLNHIASIYAYIAKDSPYHAGLFTDALMDSVEKQLCISTTIGHELPNGNNPNLRRLVYRDYVIIYHIIDSCIYIKLVEHGSREMTQKRIEKLLEI